MAAHTSIFSNYAVALFRLYLYFYTFFIRSKFFSYSLKSVFEILPTFFFFNELAIISSIYCLGRVSNNWTNIVRVALKWNVNIHQIVCFMEFNFNCCSKNILDKSLASLPNADVIVSESSAVARNLKIEWISKHW